MGAFGRMTILFSTLILLFVLIGWVIGGFLFNDWILGAIIFLIFAGIFNVISYFFSDRIILWSYRAKIVKPNDAPRMNKIVQNICLKSDMPMPRLAIVDTPTPNAFATGRNKKNAVVAATTGLLNVMSDEELEGVLAHEMAHVKNRDMLVMSVAATIAGAISFAARIVWWNMIFGGRRQSQSDIWLVLVVAITVPIAALLTQLAISRSREFKADRQGAIMIQRPLALARALEKLEEANKKRPITRGNPASASLFIVNPFRAGGFVKLFSTHPPIKERIRRLEKLSQEQGFIG